MLNGRITNTFEVHGRIDRSEMINRDRVSDANVHGRIDRSEIHLRLCL